MKANKRKMLKYLIIFLPNIIGIEKINPINAALEFVNKIVNVNSEIIKKSILNFKYSLSYYLKYQFMDGDPILY